MRRASFTSRLLIIGLTLSIAMMLTILPLPPWATWLRPMWVMLVVIYWCLALPEQFSVGMAWLIGLLLDVLQGTLLGQHALALAVVAYIIVKFHPRIRLYPIWQKTLVVFIVSFVYLALIYWIQGIIGILPKTWEAWFPAITTTLLWPWVFIILRDLRRKFNVY
jgi:rod shape-determining protein MreD